MTPKEYLLIVFQEEAIEVAHATSKVLRFTEHDSRGGSHPTNLEHLKVEFNELIAVSELLKEAGIEFVRDEDVIARKKQRVMEYMEYSKGLGVVQ